MIRLASDPFGTIASDFEGLAGSVPMRCHVEGKRAMSPARSTLFVSKAIFGFTMRNPFRNSGTASLPTIGPE